MIGSTKTSEYFDLLTKQEDLDPELVHYVMPSNIGTVMVHHPLIIELFYQPGRAAWINYRFRELKRKRDEHFERGDYAGYVFTHEKPYRLQALQRCLNRGLQGKLFWELMGEVWTNSENIHQNLQIWKRLWNSKEPGKLACMNEEEQLAYQQLPSILTVWRGVQHKKSCKGLSWTLDEQRAKWFAKRFSKKDPRGYLVHGTVSKCFVDAHFLGRNEKEIVSQRVSILLITT